MWGLPSFCLVLLRCDAHGAQHGMQQPFWGALALQLALEARGAETFGVPLSNLREPPASLLGAAHVWLL